MKEKLNLTLASMHLDLQKPMRGAIQDVFFYTAISQNSWKYSKISSQNGLSRVNKMQHDSNLVKHPLNSALQKHC